MQFTKTFLCDVGWNWSRKNRHEKTVMRQTGPFHDKIKARMIKESGRALKKTRSRDDRKEEWVGQEAQRAGTDQMTTSDERRCRLGTLLPSLWPCWTWRHAALTFIAWILDKIVRMWKLRFPKRICWYFYLNYYFNIWLGVRTFHAPNFNRCILPKWLYSTESAAPVSIRFTDSFTAATILGNRRYFNPFIVIGTAWWWAQLTWPYLVISSNDEALLHIG